MHLWMINHFAISPSQSGGTRHYTLAHELIKKQIAVTIIAASVNYQSGETPRRSSTSGVFQENINGVQFVWIPVPRHGGSTIFRLISMLIFAWRVWRWARIGAIEAPDMIIGSSPHPFAAFAAERLALRYKVPFVLEVRDLWPESLVSLGGYSNYHPFIMLLEHLCRYLYRRARKIITLLPGAGADIAQRGAAIDKIIWLPNGVDLSSVPLPKACEVGDEFQLVYAGAHGLANGLGTLLDAAAICKREGHDDVRFNLIGAGLEKEALIARARAEQLDNVTFHDPVPKTEIHSFLAGADVFYMPLRDSPVFRWGVSPNKLFDYMAAARPVIFAVNTSPNPVDEADAGISIPAEDASALVQAIRTLQAMGSGNRWRMGRNGRAYVEKNHTHAQLADKLAAMLRNLKKD